MRFVVDVLEITLRAILRISPMSIRRYLYLYLCPYSLIDLATLQPSSI